MYCHFRQCIIIQYNIVHVRITCITHNIIGGYIAEIILTNRPRNNVFVEFHSLRELASTCLVPYFSIVVFCLEGLPVLERDKWPRCRQSNLRKHLK